MKFVFIKKKLNFFSKTGLSNLFVLSSQIIFLQAKTYFILASKQSLSFYQQTHIKILRVSIIYKVKLG
jgi:hypothetical protein